MSTLKRAVMKAGDFTLSLAQSILGQRADLVATATAPLTLVTVPDVSFYQDENETPQGIDFAKMKANGAAGVIIRAGQGGWVDEDFAVNWQAAKAAGLVRGSYWYFDSRYSPEKQAEMFASLFAHDADMPEMELWADYEETYNGPYTGWNGLYRFIYRLQILMPRAKIGIYTGYYYWQANCPPAGPSLNWFGQFPLWLAWYTNDASRVLVPAPWTSLLFWQYTSTGNGPAYGVESKGIDLSYFNGSLTQFKERYGIAVDPPVEPPPVGQSLQLIHIEVDVDGVKYVNAAPVELTRTPLSASTPTSPQMPQERRNLGGV